MNTDASNVEDTKFTKSLNVCQCLALNLLENGPISFAIDHSPCARMTVTLAKGSILRRCQSPYHHRWQTCHPRVSPFSLPTFHQISTREKTTFRQCSILRSLMSKRPSQVSPFLAAAQSTSSEVSDFQIWFSPGFPMQSRQARSDPSRCIVRPNSSSALIMLWLFLHLYLHVFFSTSLQDYRWDWYGWCWTNTKDDSIHHVWNFPLSICLRVGSWCQHIWFEPWGPNWFCQTTSTLWVRDTCLIVGLLPFMIILITASLSSTTYNEASRFADWTFEGTKSMSLTTSIFLWDFWRLWTSISGFPDPSETRETFPRTETIRSHCSRASNPSSLSPVTRERWFQIQRYTTKLPDEKNGRLRKKIKNV